MTSTAAFPQVTKSEAQDSPSTESINNTQIEHAASDLNTLTAHSKLLSKKLEIASLKAEKALLKDKLIAHKSLLRHRKRKSTPNSIVQKKKDEDDEEDQEEKETESEDDESEVENVVKILAPKKKKARTTKADSMESDGEDDSSDPLASIKKVMSADDDKIDGSPTKKSKPSKKAKAVLPDKKKPKSKVLALSVLALWALALLMFQRWLAWTWS